MQEKKSQLKFEEALLQLEKITKKLEEGNPSLEESLALFEEGIKLVKLCTHQLDEVKKKIEILTKKNGKLILENFDLEKPPG